MLRAALLPVLLFTILAICFDTCMCQTFQYSRGWTNGKRSIGLINALNQQHPQQTYLQKEDSLLLPELYDNQLFEKCVLQMPHFMRNLLGRTALYSGGISLRPTPTSSNSNNNVDNNNNNNLFGSHHQSNELFDELNGAMETSDYSKH